MIITLANFFYYLFTGMPDLIADMADFNVIVDGAFNWVMALAANLGGASNSQVELSPLPFVCVVLALVVLIGFAWWLVKTIWRIFTWR